MIRLRRRKPVVAPTDSERRHVIRGLMDTPELPESVRSRIYTMEAERLDLEARHTRCQRERGQAEGERRELIAALLKLDAEIQMAIQAEAAGHEVSLHRLDEARGSIWASYTAASRALKRVPS